MSPNQLLLKQYRSPTHDAIAKYFNFRVSTHRDEEAKEGAAVYSGKNQSNAFLGSVCQNPPYFQFTAFVIQLLEHVLRRGAQGERGK
ncbi:hypothetical protein TNCV_1867901 [Trichonephila clavipes]|nr:hypothetical protein TNCV_1867901 [Trichonephila clavipes]